MQHSSTTQIVAGLSHSFRQEIDKLDNPRDNTKGTFVHKMQVEFMYSIDMVMRGSTPEIEIGINSAKRLIADLRKRES